MILLTQSPFQNSERPRLLRSMLASTSGLGVSSRLHVHSNPKQLARQNSATVSLTEVAIQIQLYLLFAKRTEGDGRCPNSVARLHGSPLNPSLGVTLMVLAVLAPMQIDDQRTWNVLHGIIATCSLPPTWYPVVMPCRTILGAGATSYYHLLAHNHWMAQTGPLQY